MAVFAMDDLLGMLVSYEGQPIGLVTDVIHSPEELERRYPRDYSWLYFCAIDSEKKTMHEWAQQFPLLLVGIGGPRKYFYIYAEDVARYTFTETEKSPIEILTDAILSEPWSKYIYMSHRTRQPKKCLVEGVRPLTYTGFREMPTNRGYSMWLGNITKRFEDLQHVGGGPNDIIIVTRRTSHIPMLRYLLDIDHLDYRMLVNFDNLKLYFITFETIFPRDFEVAYDVTGEEI